MYKLNISRIFLRETEKRNLGHALFLELPLLFVLATRNVPVIVGGKASLA